MTSLSDLQRKLPRWLPMDGVAVTAVAWGATRYWFPQIPASEAAIKIALPVAITHGLLHEAAARGQMTSNAGKTGVFRTNVNEQSIFSV